MKATNINIQTILQLSSPVGEGGRQEARLEAEVLLAHVLGVRRSYLHTWPERVLEEDQRQQFESLLARRTKGEPIAYLIGSKEFWSLPFIVSPAVLIPRPETEYLVELVLANAGSKDRSIRVLDLGTGSGAIALALAVECPHWNIVALDKSASALQIALQNAKNLAVNNVQFYQSDWFSHFASHQGERFEIMVANPPYIAPQDMHLTERTLQYEPKEAFISAPDGLQDLKRIITDAPHYLVSKGWLIVEHGFNQGAFVQAFMRSNGFIAVQGFKDLSGLDRVTIGQKS